MRATLNAAKRIYHPQEQCSAGVAYLRSGRPCRNRATWFINDKPLCGKHAQCVALRLLADGKA